MKCFLFANTKGSVLNMTEVFVVQNRKKKAITKEVVNRIKEFVKDEVTINHHHNTTWFELKDESGSSVDSRELGHLISTSDFIFQLKGKKKLLFMTDDKIKILFEA